MNSIATGMMPAPMIAATQPPAASLVGKPKSTGRASSGIGRMRNVASVTMPSWPSEPTTRPSRSRPPTVEIGPADLDDRAVDKHHFDAEHIVGRHAIFQAMRAAGIHADIAGDRAGKLRRRIGRIEEALGHHRIRDREIGHAGLHADRAIGVIDVEDARHFGDADDDRIFLRDGAARERRAGAARNDVDAFLMQKGHDGGKLFGRARQDDGERHAAIGGQRIGLEGAALVLGRDQRLRRDKGLRPAMIASRRARMDASGFGNWMPVMPEHATKACRRQAF